MKYDNLLKKCRSFIFIFPVCWQRKQILLSCLAILHKCLIVRIMFTLLQNLPVKWMVVDYSVKWWMLLFSILLQIFVNTERYILSVEVLHWSSHQLMISTSAGIKFLMLLVRKYLFLVDGFFITIFTCTWLFVEWQYSGNKHVTFMMPLDLSFGIW